MKKLENKFKIDLESNMPIVEENAKFNNENIYALDF
jgi:hypothetical protein